MYHYYLILVVVIACARTCRVAFTLAYY